ncbi:HPP family protein [Halorarum salinum]|uniref:HPP family protein n=1 Tax=Halorarum salinum TaxID=2743089 RepID=UPI001FE55539|nr:HPP family protein [Halobaculum salinum]
MAARFASLVRRLRRLEHREVVAVRRWLERTDNLVRLSALLFVPAVVALVTGASNAVGELSFLLFPPLASGTYTLFADPEGRYADPLRFVVGLTVGALAGLVALRLVGTASAAGAGTTITPGVAALSILLTGAATWILDVEEPSAFSSALLVLAADRAAPWLYVAFIFLGSVVVAGAFTVWRRRFYERRASFLYGTMRADDHVLVPMRGERGRGAAVFAARLAAAHEAGKVVLLDVVAEDRIAAVRRSLNGDVEAVPDDVSEVTDPETREAAATAARRLESHADEIRRLADVTCEVVVASGDPLDATREAVRAANCDLVVTPYEEEDGLLSAFVRGVFGGAVDAIAFRTSDGRDRWPRVLVPVSRPGDSAHAMVDFACRLAGEDGSVSVCTCIDREVERRPAENTLANVVDAVDGPIETRVARADVLEFVEANEDAYDLVMLGSSGDRSAASRAVSPPTFRKLRELNCDVAVVDRGRPR